MKLELGSERVARRQKEESHVDRQAGDQQNRRQLREPDCGGRIAKGRAHGQHQRRHEDLHIHDLADVDEQEGQQRGQNP